MNKITLTAAISRKIGDLILESTVGSVYNNAALRDENIVAEGDNQLKGFQWYCYSGSGFNQARIVSGNTIASLCLMLVPSLSPAPVAGDQYYLFKRFGWADYSAAIDEAVRRARDLSLIPFAATLSLVPTQYEYAVPSGFKNIHELQMVPSGSTDYALENAFPIDRRAWSIAKNPSGTYTIYLDTRFFNPEEHYGDSVIVRGQRLPAELGTPTANSEVLDDFLIAYSAMQLSYKMIDEGQGPLQKYIALKTEADKLESAIFEYPRASAARLV